MKAEDIHKFPAAVRDAIHAQLIADEARKRKIIDSQRQQILPVREKAMPNAPEPARACVRMPKLVPLSQKATLTRGFAQLGRIYVIPGTPVPKPRMTQRDKWQKRGCVLRYRDYCDRLRAVCGLGNPNAGEIHVVIHLAGEVALIGAPCRKLADADNFLKAVVDALFEQDKGIWKMSVEKRWTREGDERTEIVMR